MTSLQKLLPSGDRHTARGWHRFGHRDQAVRYTESWEHENFAEEQGRWERSDPEYARICEEVDKQGTGARKPHDALIRPRPTGTLAWLSSVRPAMTPNERSTL
jgi:hypothetical protein